MNGRCTTRLRASALGATCDSFGTSALDGGSFGASLGLGFSNTI